MGAILEINGIETNYVNDISNLENLFIFAKELNRANHEIIIETKLDGHIFSEEYPHQSRDIELSNIRKVEILTQTEKEFANEFMNRIPIFIKQMKNGFRKSAELLRIKDMENEGYNILALSLGVFRSFKNHLENVTVILKNYNMKCHYNEVEIMNQFSGIADAILDAQKKKKNEQIAELLETEMIHMLNDWEILLKKTKLDS